MPAVRTCGTLSKWNESRGFGFIVPMDGKQEVFVHISAFPRDGKRPVVGETISFDLQDGSDGRKRAANITRPGGRKPGARRNDPGISLPRPRAAVLAALAIAAIAVYGYRYFLSPSNGSAATTALSADSIPTQRPGVVSGGFSCDGRTHCSQMTSCAEAAYFLRHCPNTKMDSNGDGEPCEQQWCN
jgi:cold shock CspA family protein